MKEYKRLTKRDKNGFVEFEECEECDFCQFCDKSVENPCARAYNLANKKKSK